MGARRTLRIALMTVMLGLVALRPLAAQSADELVAQGDAFLEEQDVAAAYARYQGALALDPDHPGANFGLALLNLPHNLLLPGNGEINDFLADNFGLSLSGTLYDLVFERDDQARSLPPASAFQDIIAGRILPRIDESLAALAVAGAAGYEKDVSPATIGLPAENGETRTWGAVETHLLSGALNLLKTGLNLAGGYHLDLDWADLENDELDFSALLDTYPQLFTVRDQARFDAALVGMRGALDNLAVAWDTHRDRPENNYLLPGLDTLDLDRWDRVYWDDYREVLSDLRALFDEGGDTFDPDRHSIPLWGDLPRARSASPPALDLSRLFSSPLTRDNLPAFDDAGEPILDDDFDFTFNGILPGMDAASFWELLDEPDIEFHEVARHITIVDENTIRVGWEYIGDPADLADIVNFRLYRGATSQVGENDQLVGQGTPAYLRVEEEAAPDFHGGPDPVERFVFEIEDPAAPGDLYYYRVLVDYAEGRTLAGDVLPALRAVHVDRNYQGPAPEDGTAERPFRWLGLAGEALAGGATLYIAGGEYRLDEDRSFYDRWSGLRIHASNIRVVGSCNPHDWRQSDINVFPTVIVAAGFQNAIQVAYPWWWGGGGHHLMLAQNPGRPDGPVMPVIENISIENLVVRGAEGVGLNIEGGEWAIARNISVSGCVFTGNRHEARWGAWGGGIGVWGAEDVRIDHCTFADNHEGLFGYVHESFQLTNSIIAWNDSTGMSVQVFPYWWEQDPPDPEIVFAHNNVWGNEPDFTAWDDQFPPLMAASGNISVNPLFVNRAARDYRLRHESPCIGAGADGVNLGALGVAPAEIGIPGWTAWWQSIGVADWQAEPGAGPFADYNDDGELNIFKFFRGAAPDAAPVGDPAFAAADLAGEWDVHGIMSLARPGVGEAEPSIYRGLLSAEADGRFQLVFDAGSGESGRLRLGPDGLVVLDGMTSRHRGWDYSFGAMTPDRNVIFLGMNRWVPARGGMERHFAALTRRTRTDVGPADFAGAWAMHGLLLSDDPAEAGPQRFEAFVDAAGRARNEAGEEVARFITDGTTGLYEIPDDDQYDGEFTVGVLAGELTAFIGQWVDGGGRPREWQLALGLRAGGDFRPGDLAGRWAAVGFTGEGAWHYAFADADEEGNVTIEHLPGLPDAQVFTQRLILEPDGSLYSEDGNHAGQLSLSGGIIILNSGLAAAGGEFDIRALVRTAAGVAPADPEVDTVSPAEAWPLRPVPAVIAGENFLAGAVAELVRVEDAHELVIPGEATAVETRRLLNTRFDLAGATPGVYDVRVTNPDGRVAVLEQGFEVRPLVPGEGPLKLSLHLAGPAVVHPGAKNVAFKVVFSNESDGPLDDVAVEVDLPVELTGGSLRFSRPTLAAGAAASERFTANVSADAVPGSRFVTRAAVSAGGVTCDEQHLSTRVTGRYDFVAEIVSGPAWAGFPLRYRCRVILRGHRAGNPLPGEVHAALEAMPGDRPALVVDFDQRLGGRWGSAPAYGTLDGKRLTLTGTELAALLEDIDWGGEVRVAWATPLLADGTVIVAEQAINLPPGIVDPDPANNRFRHEIPFFAAVDPNAIYAAPADYVRPGQVITYTVEYENETPAAEEGGMGAATPGVRTEIVLRGDNREYLDFLPETYDLLPEFINLDDYDPEPDFGLVRDPEDYTITFSEVSRRVTWQFNSLFVPGRNFADEVGSGGGGLIFLQARVRPETPSGTVLRMAGVNHFFGYDGDGNEIPLGSWETDIPPVEAPVHVVDGTPPAVTLRAESAADGVNLRWTAVDEHSGIRRVRLYASEVGAGYVLLGETAFDRVDASAGPGEELADTVFYPGDPGKSYRFYAVAVDRAGNEVASATVYGAPGLPGDLDGDGAVTVADAVLAFRVALGLEAATPRYRALGDLTGDGRVTIADALEIVNRAVGD